MSAKIITISECSKRDIVEQFGVDASKVAVTYLGYDTGLYNPTPPDCERQAALFRRLGICKPYLLHHGGIHARKNLECLIAAYALLCEKFNDLDYQLVLAGTFSWRNELIREAAAKADPSGQKIILTGSLSDNDMAAVVKGAALCVIPSLYEGFCLPMVESMACGIPTITSNNSCFPEVSGNVLRYFDPRSVEDIAEKIEMVLFNSRMSSQLRAAGIQRAKLFSWSKCALETLNILAKVATQSEGELSIPHSPVPGTPV
jgi:glycosyltransferase involved in cell wall biosynthesis